MRRLILPLVFGLCVAAPAAAAEPVPVQWLCGLSQELTRLICVAEAPAAEPAAETAVVGGTRFPLDPRRRWEVELWSPPAEIEWLEQLARATICYRSPGCEVQFTTGTWAMLAQPLRAAASSSRPRR